MIETWRWFGPDDPVKLEQVVQAGAIGVVSSLDHIPTGESWPIADILERKKIIEAHGLQWLVTESLPIHHSIKTRGENYEYYLNSYKESIRNLGHAGITTICYNFMPAVDWTRTNLRYQLASGAYALRFDIAEFAIYDVHILKRDTAAADYDFDTLERAKQRFDVMSDIDKTQLEHNIIAGLPGGNDSFDRESVRLVINEYNSLGAAYLRESLYLFLQAVVPVAEKSGVRLCIHPDDPPFSLFGLPRIVSTASDVSQILAAVDSPANGLTFCTGSFGARKDNDLVQMIKLFGSKIHFVHLRNVKREIDKVFYEADHLDGDNDMVSIISALLDEQEQRKRRGRQDCLIPMRPDHGHLMGNEVVEGVARPGYSFIGRLKGLAELRGVLHTLQSK